MNQLDSSHSVTPMTVAGSFYDVLGKGENKGIVFKRGRICMSLGVFLVGHSRLVYCTEIILRDLTLCPQKQSCWRINVFCHCGAVLGARSGTLSCGEEGSGTPLQYSCLESPMDGGAWKAAVHGVAEGRTRLSDFTFTFHFLALEKEMATHSSVLAWRIPGTREPGGLPFLGSCRVGHDWSGLAVAAAHFVGVGLGESH